MNLTLEELKPLIEARVALKKVQELDLKHRIDNGRFIFVHPTRAFISNEIKRLTKIIEGGLTLDYIGERF